MATYTLTSSMFEGSVELRYSEAGELLGVEINGTLTPEQREWLMHRTPASEANLQRVLGNSKTAKLTKLPDIEITFEMFWDRYDDKVLSSRKRTLTRWQKMSKSEQKRAYMYVNKYFLNVPHGTRKKMAETYLNNELWNN